MIFAVFDPPPMTISINCSFFIFIRCMRLHGADSRLRRGALHGARLQRLCGRSLLDNISQSLNPQQQQQQQQQPYHPDMATTSLSLVSLLYLRSVVGHVPATASTSTDGTVAVVLLWA